GDARDRRVRAMAGAVVELERVAHTRTAHVADVMVLVAGDRELACGERRDEDPHGFASTTGDHSGSSVLARIRTSLMPAATNSAASGAACGVSRPDRISVLSV